MKLRKLMTCCMTIVMLFRLYPVPIAAEASGFNTSTAAGKSGNCYYTAPGTYTGDVNGLAVITSAGVVIKNSSITGNLVITGTASKETILDGVNVKGDFLVMTGSAVLKNTIIDGNLVISSGSDSKVTTDYETSVMGDTILNHDGKSRIEKPYSYEELKTGTVIRPYTLIGSYQDGVINNLTVNSKRSAYLWDKDSDTFYQVPFNSFSLVGNYGELIDLDGDKDIDGILLVKHQDSSNYWDPDMRWLNGIGAGSDPVVTDATGSSIFRALYTIPMGERQLSGYGLGDWSGVTDFSNIIAYGDESGQSLSAGLNYYWPQHDYYNAKSSNTLTMLTNYKTYLQTTGANCGLASALTVLDWYGQRGDLNDNDLVGLREKSKWSGATNLEQLQNVFENLTKLDFTCKWKFQSSYDNPYQLYDPSWIQSTLAKGSPIMVGWNSFGGHWQVIIGYDTMGTETTADDVLILMDPYDSTDGRNDGYNIQSYERLAYGTQDFDTDVNYPGTLYLVATPDYSNTPFTWHYSAANITDGTGYTIAPASNAMKFGADYGARLEKNWISYRDTAAGIQNYYPDTELWGSGDDGLAGPATGSYRHSGDVENSSYYSHFNFFDMKSNDHLTMLSNFKTTQQSTEWTCGLASALMNIEWFGKNPTNSGHPDGLTEIDLAQMRQGGKAGATTVNGMEEVFQTLNKDYKGDWAWFTMRDLDKDLAIGGHNLQYGKEDGGLIPYLLSNGIPMMIGWDEWGGHWQVVIGYDTMGTPGTQDDVLILADPYDTTDHNQDGYVIESFERLVFGWTAQFDEENSFVVAFPATGYGSVMKELGLKAPYYTAK